MNPIYWSIIIKIAFLSIISILVERKLIQDVRAARTAKILLSIIFLGSILIAGAGWIAVDVAHL